MFTTTLSGGLNGIESYLVRVEVDTAQSLPGFDMVGMLSSEVREAKERVRVALKNTGIRVPPVRITVNLSPADIRKEGTAYDLPIAVGVLKALELIPCGGNEEILFLGELGLNGEVKAVRGVLPIVLAAREKGITCCIVPKKNAQEACVVQGMRVVGIESVSQLCAYLCALPKEREKQIPYEAQIRNATDADTAKTLDFADMNGQPAVRRAVEIAAAGFHHLMLIGPPGSGKTMTAKRIPSILPPLSFEESLEVSKVYSVSGLLHAGEALITKRPFLNPHHTISKQALAGGGRVPLPGVISLAHRGVLFLGGYFCKTAETPNLRALWRFSYLEFFKKSAKTILHTTFWNCVLPLFDCFFAERFMVADYLMAKPYTIWQKEETKWRNYTRMAKGEGAYGI